MISLKQRVLAGLLLSLVVAAAAGVSPIQAHRSASLGITPCRSCTQSVVISYVAVSGSYGAYMIQATGMGFTPYHRVYAEVIDTTTNAVIDARNESPDWLGDVQVTLYPGLQQACYYWPYLIGSLDHVSVLMFDTATQRWTAPYPVC
jgi:hypothetical protein